MAIDGLVGEGLRVSATCVSENGPASGRAIVMAPMHRPSSQHRHRERRLGTPMAASTT